MRFSLQFIALALSKAHLLLADMKWHREVASASAVPADASICAAAPPSESPLTLALPATRTMSDTALRAPGSACSGVPPYAAPHLRMPLAYVCDSLAAVLDVLRDALSDPYIAQRSGLQSRVPIGVPSYSSACYSSASGANGASEASGASGAAGGADGDDGGISWVFEEGRSQRTADAAGQRDARVARVIKACISAVVPAERLVAPDLSWSGAQVANVADLIATALAAAD
jgi:hypothetical protein